MNMFFKVREFSVSQSMLWFKKARDHFSFVMSIRFTEGNIHQYIGYGVKGLAQLPGG